MDFSYEQDQKTIETLFKIRDKADDLSEKDVLDACNYAIADLRVKRREH